MYCWINFFVASTFFFLLLWAAQGSLLLFVCEALRVLVRVFAFLYRFLVSFSWFILCITFYYIIIYYIFTYTIALLSSRFIFLTDAPNAKLLLAFTRAATFMLYKSKGFFCSARSNPNRVKCSSKAESFELAKVVFNFIIIKNKPWWTMCFALMHFYSLSTFTCLR